MTKKAWIIFAVMCVALVGGMIYLSNNRQVDVSDVDVNAIQVASDENGQIGDQVYGNPDSKVRLIEYADFQCPGCASAHPEIQKVVEKYKDKIAFVFRNFPMSYHQNAMSAAAAAEAAGLQGKYWEMNNLLYEKRSEWSDLSGTTRTDYFTNLAEELKLDTTKFREDLDNPNIRKKINYDAALAKQASVTGTPGFRLNGKDVGNQKVLDGKLVDESNTDSSANYVWAKADDFDKFIIQPALKEAGIN